MRAGKNFRPGNRPYNSLDDEDDGDEEGACGRRWKCSRKIRGDPILEIPMGTVLI